jgi:hypothetical protein
MSEILILTSINGRILTNKLIDLWFDTNEIFITKKIFSQDQYSVEITFIDEESMKQKNENEIEIGFFLFKERK